MLPLNCRRMNLQVLQDGEDIQVYPSPLSCARQPVFPRWLPLEAPGSRCGGANTPRDWMAAAPTLLSPKSLQGACLLLPFRLRTRREQVCQAWGVLSGAGSCPSQMEVPAACLGTGIPNALFTVTPLNLNAVAA